MNRTNQAGHRPVSAPVVSKSRIWMIRPRASGAADRVVFALRRSFYLKTTLGRAVAVAVFLDGGFDDLGDESLGQLADFRVNGDGGGEGAAAAPNHDPVFVLLDLGGPADGRQHLQSDLRAFLKVSGMIRGGAGRDVAAYLAQDLLDLPRLQTILENGDELVE